MERRRENLLIEILDVFSKVYFVQLNIISVFFLGNVSTLLPWYLYQEEFRINTTRRKPVLLGILDLFF
jgi:hypothetical protein